MGIPTNMFTVMFTLGRLPGWIRAVARDAPRSRTFRIGRPRQVYVGATKGRPDLAGVRSNGSAHRPQLPATGRISAKEIEMDATDHRDPPGGVVPTALTIARFVRERRNRGRLQELLDDVTAGNSNPWWIGSKV